MKSKRTATAVTMVLLLALVVAGRLGIWEPGTAAAPPAVADAPAAVADAPARIRVSNVVSLRARVDKEVTVYGRVERTNKSRSGHQFLNFRDTELTVICRSADVANFKNGAPADRYRGKDVEVTGRLELYKEKLQIRLRDPRQIRIVQPETPAKIAGVELREIRRNHWLSPAGLVYKGYDPGGLTRVEHVERHARDIPDRDGPHGVFDGGSSVAFATIDEAWKIAQKKRLKARVEGDRSLYNVPMGRRVGYLGGRVGKRKRHPALTRVQIVFETGNQEHCHRLPEGTLIMRPEQVPHLAHCGFCDQGMLRLMRCSDCQQILAVCDECELIWQDLEQVREDPQIRAQGAHPYCPACGTKHATWALLDEESIAEANLKHLFIPHGGEEERA